MTKDRRLGRGLAALLGTPLDESQTIDAPRSSESGGTATAVRAPSSGSTAVARGTIPPNAMGSTDRTQTNRITSALPSESDRPAVTGSVPLRATPAEAKAPVEIKPLGETRVSSESKTGGEAAAKTLQLSVYEIDNNPFQPRRKFHEEEIASLAESIREHEQLQPILVRRVGDRYQLISGERRLRATIHAGLKTIRAEVREADDRLVAELAIVENLQRKDLDAIEKALSFRRYIDEHKCRQDDLAKRLKIDRSTIANLMRLLELPTQLQQWVQDDKLSAGHARTLLPLGNERQQLDFAKRIMEEGWSVRETERRVSEQLKREDGTDPKPTKTKTPSPQIAALEQQLRLALGTKIEIKQTGSGRGKITISFANNDEFERLREIMCPEAARRAA